MVSHHKSMVLCVEFPPPATLELSSHYIRVAPSLSFLFGEQWRRKVFCFPVAAATFLRRPPARGPVCMDSLKEWHA